ncbi:type VI secretion system baseplate subunit TssG [Methylocystis heyeri]|uniref:type VI secretion system baseplate subunit TssG n=1 Tax=Methylocystis heyeri TaxID=391905 RepID=UPI001134E1E2|nr:type VI secretion system baseplate subunit TssG [Methylocystis heyeri]
MSYFKDFEQQPWRFDFFDLARHIERSLGSGSSISLGPRPRIGDSASRKDETIDIDGRAVKLSFGQDPWMAFPGSNVSAAQWRPRNDVISPEFDQDAPPEPDRLHFVAKFLGLLGPQGALPLSQTEETYGWLLEHDSAYAHFLDIFNNRFLQLFYRAWADARPIVQHDRPDCDRFGAYVNSVIGVGSPAFANVSAAPSGISLYAGVLGTRIKSSSRLKAAIRGLFGVAVEIEELVGGWLVFEESDLSRIGRKNCGLGSDLMLGAASFSVQDRFRIRIIVENIARYRDFLPAGEDCRKLADLVFFHIGEEMNWDVEIALPASQATPVRLGEAGELGWTSWMAPDLEAGGLRSEARFNPAECARRKAAI